MPKIHIYMVPSPHTAHKNPYFLVPPGPEFRASEFGTWGKPPDTQNPHLYGSQPAYGSQKSIFSGSPRSRISGIKIRDLGDDPRCPKSLFIWFPARIRLPKIQMKLKLRILDEIEMNHSTSSKGSTVVERRLLFVSSTLLHHNTKKREEEKCIQIKIGNQYIM